MANGDGLINALPVEQEKPTLWQALAVCPACAGKGREIGEAFSQSHLFGSVAAPPPPERIRFRRCEDCTLIFKNFVPTPALLTNLTSQAEEEMWKTPFRYQDEKRLIAALGFDRDPDVLDVGAADGLFLQSLDTEGRKSALDIISFHGLETSGEFIRGFLDAPHLAWSGKAYDVVTVFDVMEHLYDPQTALANLRGFVKADGRIIIETGDADCLPETRLKKWDYINYLAHHLGWNEQSLTIAAEKSGFFVERLERKVHKSGGARGFKHRIKYFAFSSAPRLYRAAYSIVGRPFSIPIAVEANDHIRLVLRPS